MDRKYVVIGEGFYDDNPIMLNAYRVKFRKEDELTIKGLSDIRRPPRLGKIRLGIKKTKQKKVGNKMVEIEYPAEVDYFILDPETPDPATRADLIAKFQEIWGDQPKKIDIMLPSSDLNEAFPQNYTRFGKSSSLKCLGDGETAIVMDDEWKAGLSATADIDKESGKQKYVCNGRECIYSVNNPESKAKECSASATLNVLIRQLPGMGVWQITTGSFHSIVNINSCIQWIELHYGRAHMIPLVLERRPKETKHGGKASTHYMLHINAEESVEQLLEAIKTDPTKVMTKAASLPLPDADTTERPTDPEDAIAEVIEQEQVGEATEEQEIDRMAEADTDKDQAAFVDGLKKDNMQEYGVGESPTFTAYDLPEEVKALSFWEFMPKAKLKMKNAGYASAYVLALETYNVGVLSDIKDDEEKQESVRVLIEAEMEEKGIKW
jgi:hypothetical protein